MRAHNGPGGEIDPMALPRRADFLPAWYEASELRVCRADACESGDKPCPCPDACRLTATGDSKPSTLQERLFFWMQTANSRDVWRLAGWFTVASFASLGAVAYIIWG